MTMHCLAETLELTLPADGGMVDITAQLQQLVAQAQLHSGSVHVSCIGSTGSVTTIEHEPGVVRDLQELLTQWAPPSRNYYHEQAWHDGNGHSHVQAALIGPSESFAIRQGQLQLGTWQQVVVINHDIRQRCRRVEVTLMGE